MASRVKDIDKGAKALLERLSRTMSVKVGVIGSDAVQAHKKEPELTVVDVATKNEFGIGVPRRSWLRDYVDQNERTLKRYERNVGREIIQGMPPREAMGHFGNQIVGEIQQRISDHGVPPPNSRAWEEIKGSNTPLINTGQLWSSITHAVEEDD